MAVTPVAYGLFLQSLWEGRIDLTVDPLMCMLVGDAYVPNQNTHKFRSIVIDEIVGSGYGAGGKQVTGVQLTYEMANKRLVLTGSNLVWPSVTIEDAAYGVLYVDNGMPLTAQPLVAYVDFGELVDRTDEPFAINWPVAGIMTMAVP
jgi:hypothetical protein